MLALLFPGQGSQEVGMGRDVFEASSAGRAVFDAADASLGFPISRLCFEGPEDELLATENQQPAILTVSIALLRALEEKTRVAPAFVGGHSLGEYSALVAAGALAFEDAVRLVHLRGRFMQEAVPQGRGAMAAVMGIEPDALAEVCARVAAESGQVVQPANYNSPQQTVIAGDGAAVELACGAARDAGARRAIPLNVSAPFHCPLMEPAAAKLELELAQAPLERARVPVVTNVEAEPNVDPERARALLRKQVTAPVRFTDMVAKLSSLGVSHYLEVGPGNVLMGLLARIQRRARRASLDSMNGLGDALEFVAEAG